jgi:NAD(P)-dependent dehydrogenase (short-subunit alcohol dehydrogenase family)
MALELAIDKIRANIVAPGVGEIDMNWELRESKVELVKVLKRIPMGRVANGEEVANVAVEFLASDKAKLYYWCGVLCGWSDDLIS